MLTLLFWSLIIYSFQYLSTSFALPLFTLSLLVLSFIALLRFAFNLSNFELAIDEAQPLALNPARDDAYLRLMGVTGEQGEDEQ